MSRRKLKRVDYSKFGTSGPSTDSEDDFENSPSPKKKTDKKKIEKAERKQPTVKKKPEKSEENRPRSTRTSNADVVYEQDLVTAIEISRNSETSPPKDDLKQSEVIDLSDSDDEENVIKLLKKRKSNTIEDSSEEDSNSDNLAYADTIPVVNESTNSQFSPPSPLKEMSKTINVNNNSPVQKKTSCLDNKSDVMISKNLEAVKRTPTLPPSGPSLCIMTTKTTTPKSSLVCDKTKVETPGRLRLGLSRNIRVAKPLHSNVKVN